MIVSNGQIIYLDFFEITANLFRALTGGKDVPQSSLALLKGGVSYFILLSFCLTVLFVILIIIVWRKLSSLQEEIHSKPQLQASVEETRIPETNKRWDHVLELMYSDNPGDWRLAVLEADIALEDMISRMGYKGENLGEKLKNIEKSDFKTIDDAWEAHKIRNILAHRGSDYILTKREARRVIDLYSRVFEEFHYI